MFRTFWRRSAAALSYRILILFIKKILTGPMIFDLVFRQDVRLSDFRHGPPLLCFLHLLVKLHGISRSRHPNKSISLCPYYFGMDWPSAIEHRTIARFFPPTNAPFMKAIQRGFAINGIAAIRLTTKSVNESFDRIHAPSRSLLSLR